MDRIIEKRKWPVRRIAWITVAVLVPIIITLQLVFGDRSSKLNIDSQRLRITQVREGQFQDFIPVTGAVIPILTVYLDAMEGGRVEERFVEAGTMVDEGDKILQLSNTNLLLDIMYREAELFQQSNNLRNTRLAMQQNKLQLKAQLVELNYQLKVTKRDNDRNAILLSKNLISQRDYDETNDQYEYLVKRRAITLETHHQDSIFRVSQIAQLEASLDRMSRNLEVVKKNLENLTVTAPVSGHLTSINAEIGEQKVKGERLGQIDVLDGFKIRAPIDEHFITRVQQGQYGRFDLASSSYELVIDKVYPEVVNGEFEVDLVFTDVEPEDIRRGQTVRIRLELGALSDAMLITRGAFINQTGGRWIYVVDPSGATAEKRRIRLGRQNQLDYEVLDGLATGEQVIISSYENFGDVDKLILK
ncbi:MAG: HlyD family efflux transporter periplasmic adaptor subunit [Fidelibacterota bacterium]|nr:MAG: HlyD family efflux transporter periplasmic adaptor subunit [Candidatus Neomarinimicrobiota bacterium]